MKESFGGEDFLKKKYDLHAAPEVEAQAERTEFLKGEKVPQDPEARISNYLKRFSDILERPSEQDLGPEEKGVPTKERGVEALKRLLFRKFITKPEDIPEAYWKSQESILRERGQQADYDRFSDEEKNKWKREIAEGLLDDQKASLEQWIDYFARSDSDYLPPAMKYWVFRSVTGLQEYDKEKKVFPKRSKGTVKRFPDINHEALAYVVDAVLNQLGGQQHEFEGYDIQPEEREAFERALKAENFAKLYAWASELMNPIPEHLLPVIEGEWTTYRQGTDPKELTVAIRGKGTGWCTAGENTARTQLQGGDFHLYRTLDDEGQPTIPRIAIRMEGQKIGEVRGIAKQQNLDPYMPDVLGEKLEEFPDKEAYLKKDRDMRVLTKIERKMSADEPLGKDDLRFLYEIDSKIEGFGYSKDPRIEELRSRRNPMEDAPVVLDCEPDQIAWTPEDITPDTKAYIGPLFPAATGRPSVFGLTNLEHVYTSFPEGRVERIKLEIGGRTQEEYEAELRQGGHRIFDYTQDILKKIPTSKEKRETELVRLKVEDLFGDEGAHTYKDIQDKARELGLDLAPAESGPALRLKLKDQPMGDWFAVGMEAITDRDGYPDVFGVSRDGGGSWLGSGGGRPDDQWNPDNSFVFSSSKP